MTTAQRVAAALFSVLMVTSAAGVGVMFATTEVQAAPDDGQVLYRVNAGGAVSAAADGPDWIADDEYLVAGGEQTSNHGPVGDVDDSVPPSTPTEVFTTERWDASGDDSPEEMQYEFDVSSGTLVEIRLYLRDGYDETSQPGDRVFDVSVEGKTLSDYDIIADAGDDTGVMKAFVVTSDGTVDVDFDHGVNNPLVNAIEIVETDGKPNQIGGPSAVDFGAVQAGSGATETVTFSNLGDSGNDSHPDVTITDVSVTGPDASAFSTDFSGEATLAPGESTDVMLAFGPEDEGVYEATLEVEHSGTNAPFEVSLSGEGDSDASVGFGMDDLGVDVQNPTSLQFGPDGRLYVAEQDGDLFAFEIARNGPNDYEVTATEKITAIKDIPNHDDDGSHNADVEDRQVTGLLATGTAEKPVLYVTSSDPRIGGKNHGGETGLDTNSGVISKLTWTGSEWDHTMLVRGLPRSEENHATNGLTLDESTNTLYVAQGGNTNKGAPASEFANLPEYALSAAILSVDLDEIESMSETDAANTDVPYLYDLPTLEGTDVPFGGQDGQNMAVLTADSPVQVHSPGYRNPYDVVLTEDGQLYTVDNGPNEGWGGIPVDEGTDGICTNEPSDAEDSAHDDQLHLVTEGFYAGHPNPTRGNPDGAGLYDADGNEIGSVAGAVYDGYDVPAECAYLNPGEDDSLVTFGASTNGIAEYTASNFGGAMQGDLLTAGFAGTIHRIQLNDAGDGVSSKDQLASSFGSKPLDVTAQGDDEAFPGTVWATTYGSSAITVFEPNDFEGGSEMCDAEYDDSVDSDGDGYSNADEIDNGTDPCSAADKPSDYDDDGVSNLNDSDDDNDGIPDTEDPFAVDADNGLSTTLPVEHDFTAGSQSDSLEGIGFTGLMTDGQTDYQDLYVPGDSIFGGANPALTVEDVKPGDAHSNEPQKHAYQFGVTAADEPFTVKTTVLGFPENPEDYQSAGVYIGTGDQDNYLKLVASANGGTGGVELAKEVDGSFDSIASLDDSSVTGSNTETDLYLTVYPNNNTVVASYVTDGGERVSVGQTTVPESWLANEDQGLAVGVIATSYKASSFSATWTDISVVKSNADGDGPSDDAPTASFAAPDAAAVNEEITFDASGSSASNGSIDSYEWEFGDGDTATGQAVTHAYEDPGQYDVTLTVTDDNGATDTATKTVTITGSSTDAGAVVSVTPDDDDGASTWRTDSFVVENTGTVGIESVTLDLSTTAMPDMVFDPEGTAGDEAAKGVEADSGADETGYVDVGDDAFSAPHNGENGADGYSTLTVSFDDFDASETFTFSSDNDPTSIKGSSGSHPAGPVSGMELVGATVTVEYTDGSVQQAILFGDGSEGGAETVLKAVPVPAPSLEVENVSLSETTLSSGATASKAANTSQTVVVSGPAGADVTLLQIEAEQYLDDVPNGGYDVEQFEANKAGSVTYHSLTIGEDGTATVAVQLHEGDDTYDYFVAAALDAEGEAGDTSDTVVLEHDPSYVPPTDGDDDSDDSSDDNSEDNSNGDDSDDSSEDNSEDNSDDNSEDDSDDNSNNNSSNNRNSSGSDSSGDSNDDSSEETEQEIDTGAITLTADDANATAGHALFRVVNDNDAEVTLGYEVAETGENGTVTVAPDCGCTLNVSAAGYENVTVSLAYEETEFASAVGQVAANETTDGTTGGDGTEPESGSETGTDDATETDESDGSDGTPTTADPTTSAPTGTPTAAPTDETPADGPSTDTGVTIPGFEMIAALIALLAAALVFGRRRR